MLIILKKNLENIIPVIGAGISKRVGSLFKMSPPVFKIKRACSSVNLPSRIKCLFKFSRCGLVCSASAKNSSSVKNLVAGGGIAKME
jgi:hypothetical protein